MEFSIVFVEKVNSHGGFSIFAQESPAKGLPLDSEQNVSNLLQKNTKDSQENLWHFVTLTTTYRTPIVPMEMVYI